MLLNIDKPHRTSVLHDETCPYVPKPCGTQFKPLGSLGRDGGWFSVSSVIEGRTVAKREFQNGAFKPCPHCQES